MLKLAALFLPGRSMKNSPTPVPEGVPQDICADSQNVAEIELLVWSTRDNRVPRLCFTVILLQLKSNQRPSGAAGWSTGSLRGWDGAARAGGLSAAGRALRPTDPTRSY